MSRRMWKCWVFAAAELAVHAAVLGAQPHRDAAHTRARSRGLGDRGTLSQVLEFRLDSLAPARPGRDSLVSVATARGGVQLVLVVDNPCRERPGGSAVRRADTIHVEITGFESPECPAWYRPERWHTVLQTPPTGVYVVRVRFREFGGQRAALVRDLALRVEAQ